MSKTPEYGNTASAQTPSGATSGDPGVVLVPVNLTVNGQAHTITVATPVSAA